MTPADALAIGQQSLEVTAFLAGPILLSALAVGLLVGMLQAATQINEMTLSFIPKLLITLLVLSAMGPWMLQLIMGFTVRLFTSIPGLIG
ncbi:MAG TPA: flagellar biosynthesis protein FliQ [Chromatiaceae bacterium]|jgi:flagellar biosynthetic protein FliQ|nr:flagellar biosynthesis protein FliQ [Chromatiaceae bacterium]HIB85104.1 flagellar biosynthesis protein FliQ [Chromatiaceae bacterium]HIN82675.1 flagellar biosynthesis protein FliQ [Chromatiales bacterium]HIO14952.1 flagellar biosynthesis protein FliQ [Chromatiales bacterium]HIO53735.1 flagellar biosynthesis protein FliQ [Chromatiales bacterium]